MRTTNTEMQLINKFYEFIVWSANHTAKFPRTHKFTLGDRQGNRASIPRVFGAENTLAQLELDLELCDCE